MLSYAHGADDRPLIGQTIGDFLDAISCVACDAALRTITVHAEQARRSLPSERRTASDFDDHAGASDAGYVCASC
jgi:hypothetical protein